MIVQSIGLKLSLLRSASHLKVGLWRKQSVNQAYLTIPDAWPGDAQILRTLPHLRPSVNPVYDALTESHQQLASLLKMRSDL